MNPFRRQRTTPSPGAEPVAAQDHPVKVYEVFTPSVPASRGFVGREIERKDLRVQGLAVPGTQIAVWGESGAGKSSLVNKVLEDAGRTAVKTACTPDSTYESILAAAFSGTGAFYVSEAVNHEGAALTGGVSVGTDLIGVKLESSATYETGEDTTRTPLTKPQLTPQRLVSELGTRGLSWVIEDFHKLPVAERAAVAHALKVFSDEGARHPHTTVIVLGVAESVEELVAGPTNVGKRLIDIPVPPLDAGELGKILDAGERLLNLNFSLIRSRLLDHSVGTASITHALAHACCAERQVEEASTETVHFTHADFDAAVDSYSRTRSSTLHARFRRALVVKRRRKYKNTEIILRALANLPVGGGSVGDILDEIQKNPQTRDYPRPNLTKYIDELQEDERGALVRRTAAGLYLFDEPLQHAYAKGYFNEGPALDYANLEAKLQPGNGWISAVSRWEIAVGKQLATRDIDLLRQEVQAEYAQLDDEDTDSDELEEHAPDEDAPPASRT